MGRTVPKMQLDIDLHVPVASAKFWKKRMSFVWKKLCRCVSKQIFVNEANVKGLFSNCFWWNLPSIVSTRSSCVVYVEGFLEDIVTISKTSCVNCSCGLWRFLECKSFFEMRSLFPILNLVFRFSCNGLLYKKENKSDFLTFFGFKSIELFFREFRIVTICESIWIQNLQCNGRVHFPRIVLYVQQMQL